MALTDRLVRRHADDPQATDPGPTAPGRCRLRLTSRWPMRTSRSPLSTSASGPNGGTMPSSRMTSPDHESGVEAMNRRLHPATQRGTTVVGEDRRELGATAELQRDREVGCGVDIRVQMGQVEIEPQIPGLPWRSADPRRKAGCSVLVKVRQHRAGAVAIGDEGPVIGRREGQGVTRSRGRSEAGRPVRRPLSGSRQGRGSWRSRAPMALSACRIAALRPVAGSGTHTPRPRHT